MNDSPRSVFLVGMMGAGKTTVGRLLANALGFEFIDADRELEARSGALIATIFSIEGEEGFRRRESTLIACDPDPGYVHRGEENIRPNIETTSQISHI